MSDFDLTPIEQAGSRGGSGGNLRDLFKREAPKAGFDAIFARIWREVIRPATLRNYQTSGLRYRTGNLAAALSNPGERGNVYRVSGNQLTWGLDPSALRYVRWVIKGRGPVVAKRAKALRYFDPGLGRVVYRKRVGPAPPHDLVYLTDSDLERVGEIVAEYGLILAGSVGQRVAA